MARDGRIKFHQLLPLIVARLVEHIPGMNEATCFVSLNPRLHPDPTPGNVWLTVTPGAGSFEEGQWDGGGRWVAEADTTFTVTAHSPLQLDERGRDTVFLHESSMGLLVVMDQVLEALAGYDPVDELNQQCLIEAVQPNGWDMPERQVDTLGSIGLVFTVKFDWDLEVA